MGLLDSKSRVLDTLITEEGRIQLSQGRLKIARVAFSDASTFYEYDAASGSSDVTGRLYFEAASLPQDQVTFQSDDSGRLRPFRNPSEASVINGKIASGSALIPMDGEQFSSMAQTLLASSATNFANLRTISTIDDVFKDEMFELNTESIEFLVTDNSPLPASYADNVHITDIPEFFSDPRLSHIPNFRFMPPVIRTDEEGRAQRLFDAPRNHEFTDDKELVPILRKELNRKMKLGHGKTISMDPTSKENNVFMQLFEVNPDGTLVKLDVIRFESAAAPGKPVFFCGKVLQDGDDFKFFNIFTLVME